MSRKIELEIRGLLIEMGEIERVADELIKRWNTFSYADEEADAVGQFLVNSGLYPSLLDRITLQIQKNHKVMWPFYAEAIGNSMVDLDMKVIDAFIKGAEDQGLTHYLARSVALERFDPRLVEFRKQAEEEIERQRREKADELKAKIEFLKSQRLFEEERKALEALIGFSPQDPEARSLHTEFQERWARHLINQSAPADLSSRAAEKLNENWRREMEEHFAPIFQGALAAAKESPETAIDIALLAYFMEFHREALVILEQAPDGPSKDWLRLELCLETRRFIDALEVIDFLENKYAGDPEAKFALTLAKAKAYWGVGKTDNAIDLLTSIQNVRPNYRSVSSLLHQWRGGTA